MPFLPQQAPAGLDVEGLRKYVEEQFREVARAWTSVDAALTTATAALAAVTSAAGSVGGPCKLVATSATVLTLRPFGGGALKINGAFYAIPAAGITWSGATVNGTLYYVYAFMSGTTMTLEISTTTHATSATAGNVGTEIKSGDNTRSLVGMAYSQGTTGQWTDTAPLRLVRSWFNDFGIGGTINGGSVENTTSTTPVEASSTRCYMLAWTGEHYTAQVGGQCFNNTAAAIVNVFVGLNGTSISTHGIQQSAIASFQGWAQTSTSNVFSTDGLAFFSLLWDVSANTGSIASRVTSYMTVRR